MKMINYNSMDIPVEIELEYNKTNCCWENEQVSLWQDGKTKWGFRTATGKRNCGYASLKEAITKGTLWLIKTEVETKSKALGILPCSHMLLAHEYRHDLLNNKITCKITWRYFYQMKEA